MDVSKLDLNLLQTLDALLLEGSVTEAAHRMGISQPAMSARLARLRELFGDRLLVPSGRNLVPTAKAEEIGSRLRILLQDLHTLVGEQSSFDPATARDVFRLGGTDYAHSVLTLELIDQLRRSAPFVSLAAMPFETGNLWESLEQGRLDAAVVTSFVTLNDANARHLIDEDFVMVQRRGHPRGLRPPDVDEFCSLDHVLVSPEGGGFVGAVDRELGQMGFQRNVAVSLPHFLLVAALIAGTDMVAVVPRRLAEMHGRELDVLPLPIPVPGFGLQLVWHPRRRSDPAHVWLRGQVVSLVQTD
ncbi:MAG: LysR family transcriptional regulator [Xanthomonadales bacterium]|nr:LysR family transcriptional regulator [Xanthomonadales bacterium]